MSDKYDGEVIINTKLVTGDFENDIKVLYDAIAKETEIIDENTESTEENTKSKEDSEKARKKESDTTNKNTKEQDKASKATKDATKLNLNFIDKLAKTSVAGIALGAAVKGLTSAVSDLTNSYKEQERAEILLESAIKNNPYLNKENENQLKAFAREMQNISGVSDELIMQMQAQLIISGRTQQETMNIVEASLNIAATGAMSFDSAVRNLNKTFSGLAGELGESVPAIRNLTAEQLKNGEAVGVLSKQYEGIAKQVTDNIGTQERFANTLQDVMARIGSKFESALAPIRTYFTELMQGWLSAQIARDNYIESLRNIENDLKAEESLSLGILEQHATIMGSSKDTIALYRQEINKLKKDLEEPLTDSGNWWEGAATDEERVKTAIDALSGNTLRLLRESSDEWNKALEEGTSEALISAIENLGIQAKQAEPLSLIPEISEDDKKAIDHINATRAALEKQLEVLRLTAEATGETVDQQEVLNAYVNGYVSLITESNGLVTENNQAAKDWLNELNAIAATLPKISEDQTKAIEELKKAREALNESIDSILNVEPEKESERMQLLLDKLDKEYEAVISRKELEATEKRRIDDEYLAAREKLSEDIKRVAEEEAAAEVQAKRQAAADMATIISDFANQYAQITSTIASLAKDNITTEAEVQKLEAQKQFEEGIISQEEYEKKKQEIDKKSAKETYRIQMWEWTASILTASANIAQGITNAIATAGNIYAGIAMAALVGAAGAAQIATIIANKPIPPQFAQGGFVGGTSYTGDRVPAMVNSGEAILNSAQQKEFMRLANGGMSGGGMKVEIHNSASNVVSAQPQMTGRGMKIMIEQIIGDSIRSGRQNGNLRSADASQYGIAYTN